MNKRILSILECAALLLPLLPAWNPTHGDQVRELEREYRVLAWRKNDGLPSNWIETISQTKDGYLWIATRQGLARFDGHKFSVFDRLNTPEFQENHCTALAETVDGNLWVGTNAGLLRRNNDPYSVEPWSIELTEQSVTTLFPRRNGGVWVGTDKGIWIHDGHQLTRFDEIRFPVQTICEVSEQLWISGESNTALISLNEKGELVSSELDVIEPFHSARVDLDGDLWALKKTPGIIHRGMLNFRDKRVWGHSRSDEFISFKFFLELDRLGRLWLPDHQSLVRIEGGASIRFPMPQIEVPGHRGLLAIQCFFEDRDGNIWIGTEHRGLYCLQPRRIHAVEGSEDLLDSNVLSIAEAQDGSIWFGTDTGIARRQGNAESDDSQQLDYYLTEGGKFETNRIRSIVSGMNGDIWIGSHGGGVHRFRNGTLESYQMPGDLNDNKVNVILPDNNSVWVGTVHRLHLLTGTDTFSFVLTEPRPSHLENRLYSDYPVSFTVRALVKDPTSGEIWIGTDGLGLFRVNVPKVLDQLNRFQEDGADDVAKISVERVTVHNGLSSDAVISLHVDEEDSNVLWIGTENGLNRFSEGQVSAFTTEAGIPGFAIRQILEDDTGDLWIGSEKGLAQISKASLLSVAEGRVYSVQCVLYDETDGLPSIEFSGQINHPAGCRTVDGRLFFGTDHGPVVAKPQEFAGRDLRPSIVIEHVRVNDALVLGNSSQIYRDDVRNRRSVLLDAKNDRFFMEDQRLRFAPGSAELIEIGYTGISLTSPSKVRFRFMLEGFSSVWQDAGVRRVAFYTSLPPGDYRFRVEASYAYGEWSKTAATFAFSITPHFYETYTFYGGVLALLAAVGTAMHYWRLRYVRKIDHLEERTRLAMGMHDSIGAHLSEISSATDRLHSFTDRAALEKHSGFNDARVAVKNLSQATVEMTQSLRELIWIVHPSDSTLNGLLSQVGSFAQRLLEGAGIRCRLSMPDEITQEEVPWKLRQNVYLACKETLNNAVKHSGANEVRLRVRFDSNQCVIEICDDGRGVKIPESENTNKFEHHGLGNIKRRLEDIGGAASVQSEPNRGTKVLLKFPI